MPIAIPTAEFPTIIRTRLDNPHKELVEYTIALCSDEKRRTTESFAEVLDTPDKENPTDAEVEQAQARSFAAKSQAIRNAAKSVGARVTLINKDGKLYCQYAGEFVGMTDEQKEARKAAAAANKAAKADAEAAPAKAGKPAAKAAAK